MKHLAYRTFSILPVVILFFFINDLLAQSNYWEPTNFPVNARVFSMTANQKKHVFASSMLRVYRTTDYGVTWEQAIYGLTDTLSYSIISTPGDELFLGTKGTIRKSSDDGVTWTLSGLQNYFIIALACDSNRTLYAAAKVNGIYRSTDNGNQWIKRSINYPLMSALSLEVDNTGNLYAGIQGGLLKSSDQGTSWKDINSSTFIVDQHSIVIKPTGEIFVGGFHPSRSLDGGNTWTQIANGLPGRMYFLIMNQAGDFFAGTFNGVMRSTDNGDTWILLDTGIPKDMVDRATITPDNYLFVHTPLYGIYRSVAPTCLRKTTGEYPPQQAVVTEKDPELKWQSIPGCTRYRLQISESSEMSNPVFDQENIVTNSSRIIGLQRSTSYYWRVRGLNQITQSEWSNVYLFTTSLVAEVQHEGFPNAHSLSQNFPNPFSTLTAIMYQLSTHGHVRLEVFDMLGRKVATLVDEEREAGEYTSKFEIWDSSASGGFYIHSGVYFYRLTINDFSQTRKMIIIN